jgi:anti-sigma-K factor RskA
MKYRDPQLRQKLAAEYVLGTLQGAARLRFERLLREDARLRSDVSTWETRLSPLLLKMGTPAMPPARVWAGIRRRLFGAEAGANFWERLSFWRPLALGSGALAAALLVYLSIGQFAPAPIAPPTLAAILQDQKSQTVWLVSTSTSAGGTVISVKTLQPQPLPARQAFELWMIAGDGKPRSLGLIAPSGLTQLSVPKQLAPVLVQGVVLAVSLEPAGGSPSGSPTGPVLYQGKWQSLS